MDTKRLKIGLDVDGVLADFLDKYRWAADKLGFSYTDGVWDIGLSEAQIDECWKLIKATPNFWESVPAYDGLECLADKDSQHELVFITARVPTEGSPVNWQTSWWLQDHLGITCPTVLVVDRWKDKPALIKALHLDAFLDDKPESVLGMENEGINAYIFDQPWNHDIATKRVFSVEEFFEKVEAQFAPKS